MGIAAITFKNDLRDILNTQLSKSMSRQNKVGQVGSDGLRVIRQ